MKILTISDERLNTLLKVWPEMPTSVKESTIQEYYNTAILERESLKEIYVKWSAKNTTYRRPDLCSHLDYLYFNAFLALNLYIEYKKDWDAIKDDMQEISQLLWKFNKGSYAYSLFKHIGKNSRERNKLLIGFHNKKIKIISCPICNKQYSPYFIRQHIKKCIA